MLCVPHVTGGVLRHRRAGSVVLSSSCVCVCATLVIYETAFVRREDIVRETICDERASFKAFSVKIDFKRVVIISHTRAPSRKSVRKSSHCAIGTAE